MKFTHLVGIAVMRRTSDLAGSFDVRPEGAHVCCCLAPAVP
jgi:hypothetical protein